MSELEIQTHSFEESKNQLKQFSEGTTTDLDLKKVDSDKGVGEFLGDVLFGRGWGLSHNVTGSEFNALTTQVQNHLISINDMQRKFIKEFGQVYSALEALDKDYIQAILIAVKSAQKASGEAKTAQGDIEKTIEEQKKIIKVLQQFKEKLDQFKHIVDVDRMWGEFQTFEKNMTSTQKSLTTMEQLKAKLDKYKHLSEVDNIWNDNRENRKNIAHLTEQATEISSSIECQAESINDLLEQKSLLDAISHLSDIDQIWDNLEKDDKRIDAISEQISELINKEKSQMEILSANKSTLEKITGQKHIYDIDNIWDGVSDNNKEIAVAIEKAEKCNQTIEEANNKINSIMDRLDKMDEIVHLFDIDSLFDEQTLMKKNVELLIAENKKLEAKNNEMNRQLEDNREKLEEMKNLFVNKLKLSYLLAGGALGVAVIELLLVLSGII